MAINLDNVKSITHNNKDVIKIEDSNGNVIWSKGPQPFGTLFYLSRLKNSYTSKNYYNKVIPSTGVVTQNTYPSNVFPTWNTQHPFFTDGTDIYMLGNLWSETDTSAQSNKLAKEQGYSYGCFNWDSITVPSGKAFHASNIFSDGTNIYISPATTETSVYSFNKSTHTFTQITPSFYHEGTRISGLYFSGSAFYTDGTDLYYATSFSYGSTTIFGIFKKRSGASLVFDTIYTSSDTSNRISGEFLFKWNNKYYAASANDPQGIYDVDIATMTRSNYRSITGTTYQSTKSIWTDGVKLYCTVYYNYRATIDLQVYELDPDTGVCIPASFNPSEVGFGVYSQNPAESTTPLLGGPNTTFILLGGSRIY